MTLQEAEKFLNTCHPASLRFKREILLSFSILNKYGIQAKMTESFDSITVYALKNNRYVDLEFFVTGEILYIVSINGCTQCVDYVKKKEIEVIVCMLRDKVL